MFFPDDGPVWLYLLRLVLLYLGHTFTMNALAPSRFLPKKTIALWSVFILFCLTLSLPPLLIDYAGFVELVFSVIFVLYVIFFLWISAGSFTFKCFAYATYLYLFCVFTFIPAFITYYFFESSNIIDMSIRYALFYLPFNLIFYKFIRKDYLTIAQNVNHGFGVSAIVPVLFSISFFYKYIYYYMRTLEFDFQLGEISLSFAIMLAVYFLTFKFMKLVMTETEIKQIKMQNEFLSEQAQNYDQQNEVLKRVRHDFRHHNALLLEYAQTNQIDKLINHLKAGEEVAKKELQAPLSNNAIINAIVSSYAHKAKHKNLETKFNIKVNQELPVEDIDFVAIIANIMENAINSASQEEVEKGFLKLDMKQMGNKLIISCQNSCLDNIKFIDDIPVNKNNNGIGINSILKSAEKYYGITDFKTDGKVFTTNIILHL